MYDETHTKQPRSSKSHKSPRKRTDVTETDEKVGSIRQPRFADIEPPKEKASTERPIVSSNRDRGSPIQTRSNKASEETKSQKQIRQEAVERNRETFAQIRQEQFAPSSTRRRNSRILNALTASGGSSYERADFGNLETLVRNLAPSPISEGEERSSMPSHFVSSTVSEVEDTSQQLPSHSSSAPSISLSPVRAHQRNEQRSPSQRLKSMHSDAYLGVQELLDNSEGEPEELSSTSSTQREDTIRPHAQHRAESERISAERWSPRRSTAPLTRTRRQTSAFQKASKRGQLLQQTSAASAARTSARSTLLEQSTRAEASRRKAIAEETPSIPEKKKQGKNSSSIPLPESHETLVSTLQAIDIFFNFRKPPEKVSAIANSVKAWLKTKKFRISHLRQIFGIAPELYTISNFTNQVSKFNESNGDAELLNDIELAPTSNLKKSTEKDDRVHRLRTALLRNTALQHVTYLRDLFGGRDPRKTGQANPNAKWLPRKLISEIGARDDTDDIVPEGGSWHPGFDLDSVSLPEHFLKVSSRENVVTPRDVLKSGGKMTSSVRNAMTAASRMESSQANATGDSMEDPNNWNSIPDYDTSNQLVPPRTPPRQKHDENVPYTAPEKDSTNQATANTSARPHSTGKTRRSLYRPWEKFAAVAKKQEAKKQETRRRREICSNKVEKEEIRELLRFLSTRFSSGNVKDKGELQGTLITAVQTHASRQTLREKTDRSLSDMMEKLVSLGCLRATYLPKHDDKWIELNRRSDGSNELQDMFDKIEKAAGTDR